MNLMPIRIFATLACCALWLMPRAGEAQTTETARERAQVTRNIVALAGRRSGREQPLGSGVLLPGGIVLTACHVLDNASGLIVRQATARSEANLLEQDPERNLCRLSVSSPERFRPATLEIVTVKELSPGEPVYAVGYPLGGTVRTIEGNIVRVDKVGGDDVIQISSRLVPGYSGGGRSASPPISLAAARS
jgi:S1-C subfamily serine protease